MPFSSHLLAEAARLPSDPVEVVIGGQTFRDWFDADMDSDVFTPADGFSVTCKATKAAVEAFREGVTIDMYVAGDRQMAGVIDDMEIVRETNSTRLKLTGRDKGSYLLDNETTALHFSSYSLPQLAKKMLRPEWGIKNVIATNDANVQVQMGRHESARYKDKKKKAPKVPPFFEGFSPADIALATMNKSTIRKKTKVDAGQTIASVLDEHCKRAGVIWWMTAQGDLFLGKPNYKQPILFDFVSYANDSSLQKWNNVLKWRVRRTLSERFSEIIVNGFDFTVGTGQKKTTAKAIKLRAGAVDPDLKARGITRRKILIDHDAINTKMCQEKADEEMQRRRLRGLVISLTVPGWRQGGALYTVDTLARVKLEEAGIDDVFWIGQRRFTENGSSRRTEITLYQKGVYLP